MRFLRFVCGLGAAMMLASCGFFSTSYVTYPDAAPDLSNAPYAVQAVNVTVPERLRVSEADVYYPIADIVWRGDPLGNRYDQVAAVFRDAAAIGTADLKAGQPVVADIEVTRFHAMTEKTRYTTGGVYSIDFILTIKDAATGAVIGGPRRVNGDMPAWGGKRALADDIAGRTQRKVIVAGLAQTIRAELLTAAR